MLFSKTKYIFGISVALWSYCNALAKDKVVIVTTKFTGESVDTKDNDKVGGVGGETVIEALKAAGIEAEYKIMDWGKAQDFTLANESKNVFIIPLTRNDNREAKYVWVNKLYHNNTTCVTHKNQPKINSFSDLNGKKIAVLADSSYETMLKERSSKDNFSIQTAKSDEENVPKLEKKTVDCWYNAILGANSTSDNMKLSRKDYNYGNSLDSEHIFVATAKTTPKKLACKVQKALLKFEAKPKYSTICRKYLGNKDCSKSSGTAHNNESDSNDLTGCK